MNSSENINELATALSKAQGEMQAAIKDSVNPFFKSKYADLGSVWDAARPVLSKYGLCVMQSTELVGEKIVMVTTLAHTSGQWVKSYLPLNPSKNDSQGVGAAITYLRRYSLSALVGVVCDDEDDGETAVGRGQAERKQEQPKKFDKKQSIDVTNQPVVDDPKINQQQLDEIIDKMKLADDEWKKNIWVWLNEKKIFSECDITQSCYKPLINSLRNNIEKNKVAV